MPAWRSWWRARSRPNRSARNSASAGGAAALLGYALDHQMWEEARVIAWPLKDYWAACGLDEEARAWTDRVQLATEDPDGSPPKLDTPAGDLWQFITVEQANWQLRAMRLDDAEHNYHRILHMLQAQRTSPQQQSSIATISHNLGVVAYSRRRLEEAEDWYRKSLALREDLGDLSGMADSYYQLGWAAQDQGRLGEAEGCYRKSLAIYEGLGDRPHIADSYHQLGMVAHHRRRLGEAEDWYRKSLGIREGLGDQPRLATDYHQLGMVAQARGRLGEAEDWYRKSLGIREGLGDQPRLATDYHQLGMVA